MKKIQHYMISVVVLYVLCYFPYFYVFRKTNNAIDNVSTTKTLEIFMLYFQRYTSANRWDN